MAYILVCLAAALTAALTLFSGFGLGTLLLPVFAVFFPLEVAVAAAALVHLANNLFKLTLVGRNADTRTVAAFGLPALLAAFAGAAVLTLVSDLRPLATYTLGERVHEVTSVGLLIAVLVLVFALSDLFRWTEAFAFDRRYLAVGGLLSGFFGGLSGHQGALRAAFLVRAGLGRDAFIGTNVVCAVMVDVARLAAYGATFLGVDLLASCGSDGRPLWKLVLAGTLCAFGGSFVGARLARKITYRTVEIIVAVGLVLLALAIGAGLV